MNTLQSDLELMQSLLKSLQHPSNRSSVLDRILTLESARRELQQKLPISRISPAQQQALDILRNQACMEIFYNRRSQAILDSQIPAADKKSLLMELSLKYHQACHRMNAQWPSLTSEQESKLPLLLMRQSLESDIDQALTQLRKQMYFPQIA